MKQLIEHLNESMAAAFAGAGYDASLGVVRVSDRPDLSEFQCNGAMAAAKRYRKAPFVIAEEVAARCAETAGLPFTVEVVKPGFINLNVTGDFLVKYLGEMAADPKLGLKREERPKKMIVDYGGPNVAKPLHVGHLRAAVIGESVKRILRDPDRLTEGTPAS